MGKAISSVKPSWPRRSELPLLRLRDRLDRQPSGSRWLTALLLAEGAGRRLRPDRAVELPADDDHVEARPLAPVAHRAEAGLGDAALGAADGRRGEVGFRRARSTSSPGPARPSVPPGPPPRRRGRLHRLDHDRGRDHAARLRRDRVSDRSSAARANLVFADANLETIPSSVWSIYCSAGQSCEARSRVLVERSIHDDFVARFSGPRASRSATARARDRDLERAPRPRSYVETGPGKPSRRGRRPRGAGVHRRPCLPRSTTRCAWRRRTGPVVTVIPSRTSATRIANGVPFGLMATVWTGD